MKKEKKFRNMQEYNPDSDKGDVPELSEEQIEILNIFLKEILTADTTNGSWCPTCPEYRQSRTVSSLLQSYFGGDILCCPTRQGSMHYWNLLDSGQEIDLTESELEFSRDSLFLERIEVLDNERVIFPETRMYEKYLILRDATEYFLQERGLNSLQDLVIL
jgi:hypothetical protein